MTLWMRTRRVGSLAAALILIAALAWVIGGRAVSVPAFLGTVGSSVKPATLLLVLWAAAIADSFATRGLSVELRPAVRLSQLDGALFAVVAAGAVGAFAWVMSANGPFWAGVGPMLIASGLACSLTLRWSPGAGSAAVTVLLVLTSLYSMNAAGAPYVRVLQADGDPWWSLACGLAASSAAVWMLLRNKVVMRVRATDGLD